MQLITSRVFAFVVAAGALTLSCAGRETSEAPVDAAVASSNGASPVVRTARALAPAAHEIASLLAESRPFSTIEGAFRSPVTDATKLVVRVDASARDKLSFGLGLSPERAVSLTLQGARDVRGVVEDGFVVYADALPSVDVMVAANERRFDQLLVLRDGSAPTRYRYALAIGDALQAPEMAPDGGALVRMKVGEGALRIAPPFAVDASGVRRAAQLAIAGDVLSVSLDTAGLAFPILLDPAGETVTWVTKTYTGSPTGGRAFSPMAYVPGRSTAVLFGGRSSTTSYLQDTWEFTGSAWSNPNPTTKPAGRQQHAMAAGGSKAWLFGGKLSSVAIDGETWEWSGTDWTRLCTSGACGPTARFNSAMMYDSDRSELVLFGGATDSSNTPSDQTWVWANPAAAGQFTNKCTAACVRPRVRMAGAFAYDSKRKVGVLVGGIDPAGAGTILSDVWEWNGATAVWTEVCKTCAEGTTKPGPRYAAGIAFDSARGLIVLFGGFGGTNLSTQVPLDDTWEWDGAAFTKTGGGTAFPAARSYQPIAYMANTKRTFMFGGWDNTIRNEQYEYAAVGGPCTTTANCNGTSICEDGKCCTAACAACQRCDATGSFGTCSSVMQAEDAPSCSGTKVCNAVGTCIDKAANGAACPIEASVAAPYRCASGKCADGVCCTTDCTGGCNSCLAADTGGTTGTCAPVSAGKKRNSASTACTATAESTCGLDGTCDGASACRNWPATTVCAAQACQSDTIQANTRMCSGSGTCVALTTTTCSAGYKCTANACPTACSTDTQCAATHWCSGTTCATKKDQGATCGAANECKSGFCTDGVCCDMACNGLCEACSAAKKGSGVDGACAPVPDGADPDGECPNPPAYSCAFDGMCNGARACRIFTKLGVACEATTKCMSGEQTGKSCDGAGNCIAGSVVKCEPYKCAGDGLACAQKCATSDDCADVTFNCSSLGLCVKKSVNGDACTAGTECSSGICAEGVCCNATCAGQCESCAEASTKGTCVAVSGAPRGTRAACGGETSCAGRCNGTDRSACFFDVGKECGSTCAAGTETLSKCDATGVCRAEGATPCNGYVCEANRCKIACTASSDCATGYACEGGKCTPLGAKCVSDIEVEDPTGKRSSCAPFRCKGGKCGESCVASVDDCQEGFVCDVGKCVQSAPPAVEEGGGCAVHSAGTRERPGAWALLAIALFTIRRRSTSSSRRDAARSRAAPR